MIGLTLTGCSKADYSATNYEKILKEVASHRNISLSYSKDIASGKLKNLSEELNKDEPKGSVKEVTALKRLPENIDLSLGYDKNSIGKTNFLSTDWDVEPFYLGGIGTGCLVLSRQMLYGVGDPNSFKTEFNRIMEEVTKEYGEIIFADNVYFDDFKALNGKVVGRVYEADNFYVLALGTNNSSEKRIEMSIIYINKNISHPYDSDYSLFIDYLKMATKTNKKPLGLEFLIEDANGTSLIISDKDRVQTPEDFEHSFIYKKSPDSVTKTPSVTDKPIVNDVKVEDPNIDNGGKD